MFLELVSLCTELNDVVGTSADSVSFPRQQRLKGYFDKISRAETPAAARRESYPLKHDSITLKRKPPCPQHERNSTKQQPHASSAPPSAHNALASIPTTRRLLDLVQPKNEAKRACTSDSKTLMSIDYSRTETNRVKMRYNHCRPQVALAKRTKARNLLDQRWIRSQVSQSAGVLSVCARDLQMPVSSTGYDDLSAPAVKSSKKKQKTKVAAHTVPATLPSSGESLDNSVVDDAPAAPPGGLAATPSVSAKTAKKRKRKEDREGKKPRLA